MWRVGLMAAEEASERLMFSLDLPEKIERYLQEADEAQRCTESKAVGADDRLKAVMVQLEDEFRYILGASTCSFSDTESLGCSSISSSPSNYYFRISVSDDSTGSAASNVLPAEISPLLSPEAVYYLQCIAQRMIASGYTRECIQAYTTIRKPALDARFRMLGIEKLSPRDVQMLEWRSLEEKVRHWIRAAAVCLRDLFTTEKKLSEQIFQGLSAGIFASTVNGLAMQLLGFAEAVTSTRTSPERLFCMLDLHDALSDFLPDIEIIFEASIRLQAAETLPRLAEVIRGMLLELEKTVLLEKSEIQIPGGALHPLARYVMNYIKAVFCFEQTLTELIVSKPALVSDISGDLSRDIEELEPEEGKTPFAFHLSWIITVLQFKLEEKSKQYGDASLAHLFMMNNLHYMALKINAEPKMREMIGDVQFRKLVRKFRLEAFNYERSTWMKVLNCLRDEGLYRYGNSNLKNVLKARLKTFNAMFEKLRKTQATWVVPDVQLREDLRISISQKLIPAYRSFLGRYMSRIISSGSYIKYTPEDLENVVLDFFEEQSKSTS